MAPKRPVVYRRSRHLVSYWQGGTLVICNFASGVRVAARPEALAILDFLKEWRTAKRVRARFGAGSSLLHPFVEATLLERSDREPPRLDSALSTWERWNPAAGFFHMATRDVRFTDPVVGHRMLREKARVIPAPPAVKKYPGARRYPLPSVDAGSSLAHVLLERRTWRRFSRRPLPSASLGGLLGLTSGVQQWATLRGQGDFPLKTSPSGGARHPIETYVCVRRVEGVRPGLYHYAADRHCLELIGRHRMPIRVQRYLPTQFWYRDAAVLLFFTAVFARYLWKYSYARAYRALFIEAGHLCQTFCLVATDLGLAPFCSMALSDSRIEEDLGLDGVSESVIYAAGVGLRPAGIVSPSKPKGFPPLRVRPNPFLERRHTRHGTPTGWRA